MTSAENNLLCRRDAERRIVALTREALDPEVASDEGWESVPSDDPEVRQRAAGVLFRLQFVGVGAAPAQVLGCGDRTQG